MPKYLIQASYTAEGLKGLQKDKASGLVHTKTTALLTVEETDQALGKSINYKAPGR